MGNVVYICPNVAGFLFLVHFVVYYSLRRFINSFDTVRRTFTLVSPSAFIRSWRVCIFGVVTC